MVLSLLSTTVLLLQPPATPAEAGFVTEPAAIESEGVTLSGEWLFPDDETTVPAVILAGGTMSHTRDGAMVGFGEAAAQRDALRRLAVELAEAGYATLRWDKRGYGDTPAGPQPVRDEYEAADVAAAIELAREHPRTGPVIVAGESAGGYFACMAAMEGVQADGYIFLGALASSSKELFEHNFARLARWASLSDDNLRWAEEHTLSALAVGQVVDELFEAVERGDDTYVVRYGEHEFPRTLVRLRTQMEHPPGELFAHIHAPTLILQGTDDMNVPPGDAAVIEEVIEDAGNPDVTRVMIDDADHSFQLIASGTDARMKDRHGFTSFYRLYHSGLYEAIEEWLGDRFPTDAPKVELWHKPRPGVVTWGGIQVVPGITDPSRNDGVDTLEGRIGPLLKAEGGQAHYIDMPPNMYVPEHPHSSESIIYVVRGRFVLASDGQRRVIEAGDLFWFRRGTPTGWEMPFDEPCYILIFKTERSPMTDFDFWVYLEGLAERLEEEARRAEEEGLSADEAQSSVEGHVDVVTTMDKLAPDHPARVFARDVNPDWERELPGSPLAE